LLTLLPRAMRDRLLPQFETVSLGIKDILYEPNAPIEYVYFPLNGVMSMVSILKGGAHIEVATTGNEGMLGLPVFLGRDSTPLQAFSQVPGESLRMKASAFKRHLKAEPALTTVLQRYTQAMMVQIAQGTACNRAHSIQQRCCRWLLMTHDRVFSDDFLLTQEFLGQMLGVRRATVSEVAGELQRAGLIQYSRGRVTITDRQGLERCACECYAIIRDEYDGLFTGRRTAAD
jgi:CRP-like cAMP-binding protein